jgi:sugar-specific transcriptional regulator TrmB
MNTEILEQIGFSKGEIKVYFAMLELGQSTIGPISKKSGVTISKVYPAIEKLAKKGLSNYIIKSGTKYFQASSPNTIISYLDEKKELIEIEKKEINKIIPQIEAKQKLALDSQNAEVYETFDGIRTLYNEIIQTLEENKDDFIGFTLGEEEYAFKESEHFFNEYDTKRRERGINVKLLGFDKQRSFLKKATKEDKNITIKFLPYKLPTGVIIFGDKVATLTWQEIPRAFVIQSKQVADSYRKFFEDMWKQAKK